MSITIPDYSFETISVPAGTYISTPTGSPWTFTNNSGQTFISNDADPFQGGYVGNGTDNAAPNGVNVAILLGNSTCSQSIAGWTAGTYTLTFQASNRRADLNPNPQTLVVSIDGNQICSVAPPCGYPFNTYTSNPFTLTDGSHTIQFAGSGTDSGSCMFDNVQVALAVSPLVSGTLSTSVVTDTTLTLTTTALSGGTSPYSIQFQKAPNVAGSPDAPGSWYNVGTASTALTCNVTGLTATTKYWFRTVTTDSASATTNGTPVSAITLVAQTQGTYPTPAAIASAVVAALPAYPTPPTPPTTSQIASAVAAALTIPTPPTTSQIASAVAGAVPTAAQFVSTLLSSMLPLTATDGTVAKSLLGAWVQAFGYSQFATDTGDLKYLSYDNTTSLEVFSNLPAPDYSEFLSAPLPLTPTPGTIGEAYAAARADFLGKVVYDATAKTLTVYSHDNITILKTLTCTTDSRGNVVGRS